MTTVSEPAPQTERPMDRQALIRQAREIDAQAGILDDPTVTHEKLRVMVLADMAAKGIKPEDNIFSRDIINAREPDGYQDDEE